MRQCFSNVIEFQSEFSIFACFLDFRTSIHFYYFFFFPLQTPQSANIFYCWNVDDKLEITKTGKKRALQDDSFFIHEKLRSSNPPEMSWTKVHHQYHHVERQWILNDTLGQSSTSGQIMFFTGHVLAVWIPFKRLWNHGRTHRSARFGHVQLEGCACCPSWWSSNQRQEGRPQREGALSASNVSLAAVLSTRRCAVSIKKENNWDRGRRRYTWEKGKERDQLFAFLISWHISSNNSNTEDSPSAPSVAMMRFPRTEKEQRQNTGKIYIFAKYLKNPDWWSMTQDSLNVKKEKESTGQGSNMIISRGPSCIRRS
jgi:hypothetical protein